MKRISIIMAMAIMAITFNTFAQESFTADDFHLSAWKGDLEKVKEIYQSNPDLINESWKPHRGTALHAAAYQGHVEVAKWLVENGADVNNSEVGYAPLNQAAMRGNLEIVKLMVEKGADVNARRSNRSITPLMDAADANDFRIVSFLLQSGADVKARDNRGWSALHWVSCEHGYLAQRQAIAAALIAAGLNPEEKTSEGYTSYDLAYSEIKTYQQWNMDVSEEVYPYTSWLESISE